MTPPPWLALDTGGPVAVITVCLDGVPLADSALQVPRRHAEALAGGIDDVLRAAGVTFSDLGGIAVGRGPGSFVGIRVGIATAKGIALARGIPLLGLCPLRALASHPTLPDGVGLACIDARRGEIYGATFERSRAEVTPRSEPLAASPHRFERLLSKARFAVGTGVPLLPDSLLANVGSDARRDDGPLAAGVAAALAARLRESWADERAELVPRYCRAPDAKRPGPSPALRP